MTLRPLAIVMSDPGAKLQTDSDAAKTRIERV